jgi:hypothetical protein
MDFRESTHSAFLVEEGFSPVYRNVRPSVNKRPSIPALPSRPAEPRIENLILRELPAELRRTLDPSLRTVNLAKEQFLYQEGDDLEYV